ncbi:hypothetical protein ACI6QG_11310 [Roseococcus sp. DSY-14]|uniref:hypothetical protein n=1 Tax=Roseococcus sp. DSY-14 TaxID=3369650 RepID=UPI00387B7626
MRLAMKRYVGVLGMGLLAAGCAGGGESSGVVALGPDVFVIENRGGLLPGVVERTLEEAAAFCGAQGNQAEMLTTRVNPQSYQVAFRCMGRLGAVPVAMVPQPPGTPANATRRRAVLEAAPASRQRRRVVSAPDWAAQPAADQPAVVAAPAAAPAPVLAVPGPAAAPLPPGVAWATPEQAAPFASAIPGSVFTPAPMPAIQPAPDGASRRMSGRAAEPAPAPVVLAPAPAPAPQPAPLLVPMGVPLLPAQPAASAPALAPAQPAAVAPALSRTAPPTAVPGPAAATPRAAPAAMAPVAGPVFQPSANPLPAASAPLSAVPPAGFWQTAR